MAFSNLNGLTFYLLTSLLLCRLLEFLNDSCPFHLLQVLLQHKDREVHVGEAFGTHDGVAFCILPPLRPPATKCYIFQALMLRMLLRQPIERADAISGWKEFTAKDGRKYYYNKETKESKWTMPEEMIKVEPLA